MLSVHLANIKSSGIYRFVFDKSEVPSTSPSTLRLVVGYSEKGPFNTVTYVKNATEFKEIYGGISKRLEKYGCFFHRIALQCLTKEPILCLNLKNFETEKVQMASFDPYKTSFVTPKQVSVNDLYDTTRLWTLSPEHLPEAYAETYSSEGSSYITISATDDKKNSSTVYIRPSLVNGYDVTLKDWYENYCNGEYPEYVENYLDTLVSDYMVDVYIFRGKFTKELASSDTFANYFAIDGDNVYIRDYVQNTYGEKKDALEEFANVDGSGFIAKYTGVLLPYFKTIDGAWFSIDLQVNNGTSTHNVMMYMDENYLETKGLSIINLGGYNKEDFSERGTVLSNAYYLTDNIASYMYNNWEHVTETGHENEWKIKDNSQNDFTYGDVSVDIFENINKDTTTRSVGAFTYSTTDPIIYSSTLAPINVGDKFIAAKTKPGTTEAQDMNLVTVLSVEIKDVTTNPYFEITLNGYPAIYQADDSGNGGFIVRYNFKMTAHASNGLVSSVITDTSIGMSHKGAYLEGYTYSSTLSKPTSSLTSAKLAWINSKLEMVSDKGIFEALTNKIDVDYRYIVDSFESFPEDQLKSYLSYVARKKENAFVISNFPLMKTFIKDKEGAYTDVNGVFHIKYVAAGHNKAKNVSTNISMPTEANGASYIAFYTPVKLNDSGIKIDVPSAGLVSNNFMDKYSSRKPYFVVAGPSYGKMIDSDLIGPDYNFTREDLDYLEPMGVNCMVYRPTVGTYINSNQTAKQKPVTGMSKINIVELVIYLQDEIATLLQSYQWELNTQTLRSTIKAKADAICENIYSNGGLYNYSNVCDETNNTDEVIDNEMLVLSTSIEPAKGAGKMIHELTIYRKGGMSSVIK